MCKRKNKYGFTPTPICIVPANVKPNGTAKSHTTISVWHRCANRCEGFSLVEMMVAFAIIVIIFAAVVPQFRAIRNSWASAEAGAVIIQNGRVLAEHITRNLAAAKRIVAVSIAANPSGFITFNDNNGIQKHYMLAGGYVVFGTVGSEEQLAGPVDGFQISCYSLSDFKNATTDVNSIRLVQFETEFTNADVRGTDKTFSSEVFIQANAQEQSVIDIMVKSGQSNTVFDYVAGDNGCNAVIEVDNWDNPSVVHGLLCFKDIIGDANGQVPLGTAITQAKIKLWYVNHNGNKDVYFYRMTRSWDETSTWNSIGGGVLPGTNCGAASVVTANLGNSVPTTVEIDVTDIVQGWISGDYANYGFGIINSSNNNLQFAAAENTTGSGDHTPILEVTYQPSSTVGVIGSWVAGTTHAKEAGTNRALVFLAHSWPGSSVTLTAVSYGGQSMTYVIDKTGGSGPNRTYAAAFILNEAGVSAAGSDNFNLTWSGVVPTSVAYSSVFLQNVNQTTLTGASDSDTADNANVTTPALATNSGDMVIDVAACNATGSYTVNNGFTKALELDISDADGVDGYKSATGANETPSVTHNPSGRQVLLGFVVKAFAEERTFGGETIPILP